MCRTRNFCLRSAVARNRLASAKIRWKSHTSCSSRKATPGASRKRLPGRVSGRASFDHASRKSGEAQAADIRIDFRYGDIELGRFSFQQWNKLRNRVIADHQQRYMVEEQPQGEFALRKELVKLLHETRSVRLRRSRSSSARLHSSLCRFSFSCWTGKSRSSAWKTPAMTGRETRLQTAAIRCGAYPLGRTAFLCRSWSIAGPMSCT